MVKIMQSKAPPSTLPNGWQCIITVRRSGKSEGTRDKHYLSPTLEHFRSLKAVRRYLAIIDVPLIAPVDPPVPVVPAVAVPVAPVPAPAPPVEVIIISSDSSSDSESDMDASFGEIILIESSDIDEIIIIDSSEEEIEL